MKIPISRTDLDDLERLKAEYADRETRLAGRDLYSYLNVGYLYMSQQRQRDELGLLRAQGLTNLGDASILEIGCGRGGVLLEYLRYGPCPERLHGVDLLPDRVQSAHRLLPHLPLACADGQNLPYPAGAFDLVLQYTVFSSILDEPIKARMAGEMLRVLKPGGLILWYDFWVNPTNPQTRGVRPAEIRRLFPDCRMQLERITLAPPIARKLAPISWLGCALLEKLKIFNTHYLAAIHKPVKIRYKSLTHSY